MNGRWHGRKCPNCGIGTLHDRFRQKSNDYRGNTFVAKYPVASCDNCDDAMAYDAPDIDERWEQFCRNVDEAERLELSAIRARLKLTQEEASRISGGGHNAFSRYERGEAKPVFGIVTLFRLLGKYPALLDEIHGYSYSQRDYSVPPTVASAETTLVRSRNLAIASPVEVGVPRWSRPKPARADAA